MKIELTEEQKQIILKTIVEIAKNECYFLSKHATEERFKERHFTIEMVEDILLNPTRIIRAEQNDKTKDVILKIEGGKQKRKLAITINGNLIFVLTVM